MIQKNYFIYIIKTFYILIILDAKLNEINKEKYLVIILYFNKEKDIEKLNKEFIPFNYVIKSLFKQYSNKISRNAVKK